MRGHYQLLDKIIVTDIITTFLIIGNVLDIFNVNVIIIILLIIFSFFLTSCQIWMWENRIDKVGKLLDSFLKGLIDDGKDK